VTHNRRTRLTTFVDMVSSSSRTWESEIDNENLVRTLGLFAFPMSTVGLFLGILSACPVIFFASTDMFTFAMLRNEEKIAPLLLLTRLPLLCIAMLDIDVVVRMACDIRGRDDEMTPRLLLIELPSL
jgi:hypothetical protein